MKRLTKPDLFKVIPVDIGECCSRTLNLKTKQLFQKPCKKECFIEAGVLKNPKKMKETLELLLEPVWQWGFLLQPTMITSVASHVTQVEREILTKSLYEIGARKVLVFSSALAAALGSGINFSDSSSSLILEAGHGVAQASVVSLGQVNYAQTSFFAGSFLDRQLASLLRQKYFLSLSERELFQLKKQLDFFQKKKLTLKGKDLKTGRVKTQEVDVVEFQSMLYRLAEKYVLLVEVVLSQAPAGVVVDAVEKGLILTGGLALINGFSRYLTSRLNFPVLLAEEPELTNIWGLAQIASQLDEFEPLAYAH